MRCAYLCCTEKEKEYIDAEACVDIAQEKGIREEKGCKLCHHEKTNLAACVQQRAAVWLKARGRRDEDG